MDKQKKLFKQPNQKGTAHKSSPQNSLFCYLCRLPFPHKGSFDQHCKEVHTPSFHESDSGNESSDTRTNGASDNETFVHPKKMRIDKEQVRSRKRVRVDSGSSGSVASSLEPRSSSSSSGLGSEPEPSLPPSPDRNQGLPDGPAGSDNNDNSSSSTRPEYLKPSLEKVRGKFPCPVIDCEMVFSQRDHRYKNHLEIHEGLKPFVCEFELCGFGYDDPIKLIQHVSLMHTHHSEFECPTCNKTYKMKYHLDAHIAKLH